MMQIIFLPSTPPNSVPGPKTALKVGTSRCSTQFMNISAFILSWSDIAGDIVGQVTQSADAKMSMNLSIAKHTRHSQSPLCWLAVQSSSHVSPAIGVVAMSFVLPEPNSNSMIGSPALLA